MGCGRVDVFATGYIVPFAGGQAAIVVVGVGLELVLRSGTGVFVAFVELVAL